MAAPIKMPPPNMSKNIQIAQSVPEGTILAQPGIPSTQATWIAMINSAKKSLDIGAFYFTVQKGDAMVPVLNAIKKAAARGVQVRILLGGLFYPASIQSLKPLVGLKNVTLRKMPIGKITGGIMHAKYMIIDDAQVFVGSANFDWRALTQIHEIGVRVRSKRLAQTLTYVFNTDWQISVAKNFLQNPRLLYRLPPFQPVTAERPIIVNDAGKNIIVHPTFDPKSLNPVGVDWGQQKFIKLLGDAQHSVIMQVMQFSPAQAFGDTNYWSALTNAIHGAASRGVKVKLIVANWDTHEPAINYLKSLSLSPNVEIKISTIPEGKKFIPYARVEHCKYFVVDNDLTWIGTGNWTKSYFNSTRDISLILDGSGPAKTMREIFYRDWNGPYTKFIDVNKHYTPPKTH